MLSKSDKIIFPQKRRSTSIPHAILFGFFYSIVIITLFVIGWGIYLWFFMNPLTLLPPNTPVSSSDGAGIATISPDVINAGEKIPYYTITFKTAPAGIQTGGKIKIIYPAQTVTFGSETRIYIPFLSTQSIRWFRRVPIEVTTDGDAKLKVTRCSWLRCLKLAVGYYKSKIKGVPAYSLRELAREIATRTIVVEKGKLDWGRTVTIKIGGRKGVKAPSFSRWVSFAMLVDGDGDGVAVPIASSPRVVTTGSKATGFRVVASSAPKIWEKMKVTVAAVDDKGQVDPDYRGIVYLDAPQLPLPGVTEFTASDLGRKTFSFMAPREGIYFITARDSKNRRGKSNPIVVEEAGPHLYWGDLHLHSVLDVGSGLPEWVMRIARDELALDFASLVLIDHVVPFKSHLLYPGVVQSDFAWGLTKYINAHFDSPGVFSALKGFEWGDTEKGHRLVIYSPDVPDPPLLPHRPGLYDSVEKLFSALRGRKAVVAPVHSAWRGGKFMSSKYDWGPNDDSYQRLVEIYSSNGACEYYNNPYAIHARNEIEGYADSSDQAGKNSGAFVQDALAKDYKLAFIAGSDGRFDIDRPPHYPGGLTAVWAPQLTSQDIWNSLYSRKVYATTGARIFVKWTVGGGVPGSEIGVDSYVEISLFVVGTAPIKEAQIIKWENGYQTARTFSSPNEILSTTWTETNPPYRGFYYLRITQEDGHMAWAGPIWVYRR